MKECALCEYKGYSSQLCKMHERHALIASKKQQLHHKQMIAKFDKQKMIKIIEREERNKKLKATSLKSALGAGIGAGGGYAGATTIALLGGAAVAHAVAAPLIIGAAMIGGGVVAAKSLKKKHNGNSGKKGFSRIYGLSPNRERGN